MRFLTVLSLAVLMTASTRYVRRYRYRSPRRTARDFEWGRYLRVMAEHRRGVWA